MFVMLLRHLGIFLLLFVLIGCVPTESSLTTYPWQSAKNALHLMAQRADTIKTLSAQCTLTLERPNATIQLDGAIVAQTPSHLRLRAWKFGRTVMDLTLRPDGMWIWMNQEAAIDPDMFLLNNQSKDQPANMWPMLNPGHLRDADLSVQDDGGSHFLLRQPLGNASAWQLETLVHRMTLTVREYRILNTNGQVVQRMKLSQYQQFLTAVWPMRIEAVSHWGSITLQLRALELNNTLNLAAFTPLPRAKKTR